MVLKSIADLRKIFKWMKIISQEVINGFVACDTYAEVTFRFIFLLLALCFTLPSKHNYFLQIFSSVLCSKTSSFYVLLI